MKLTVVFIVTVCSLMCPSVSGEKIKRCGWKLANALSQVCRGVYQGPPGRKRDVSRQMTVNLPSWLLAIINQRPGTNSPTPFYFTNRQQRGIVDECCSKGCTVEDLMSYCG